jgi:hypothetical protein
MDHAQIKTSGPLNVSLYLITYQGHIMQITATDLETKSPS